MIRTVGFRPPRSAVLPLLLLALLTSACATAPPRNTTDVCSIFKEKRGWHKAAVRLEKKWGAPMHIPLAIMEQESAFRSRARPPRRKLLGFIPWRRPSSAFGYAQAVNSTWAAYVRARNEPWRDRRKFADALDFIFWYTGEAARRNGIPRHDGYSLYINYHEGVAGYAGGSHHGKPWLDKVARGVQIQSQRYAEQYAACREDLKPGFWGRLLGW